jgi:hypothetical protein
MIHRIETTLISPLFATMLQRTESGAVLSPGALYQFERWGWAGN